MQMYIEAISHYLPKFVFNNKYFKSLNGLSDEWILQRTGIKQRRKASKTENTNVMAIKAVKNLFQNNQIAKDSIDLIIGATYTPFDTVGTLAHAIQKEFNIKARAISISTACSSFVNAVEIVEGYFASEKSKLAIIAVSEHNSAYNDETSEISGHLWGDGAAAVLISKEKLSNENFKILDIHTEGLGNLGKGTQGVFLHPLNGGLVMPYGKDVFIHACKFMSQQTTDILNKNKIPLSHLNYLIPHQANIRIIENVRAQLQLNKNKVITNIDRLGNTGCASIVIGLSENKEKFKKGDFIVISVFGGGYSCGAMLLKK